MPSQCPTTFFEKAEATARRLRISRSELYAKAMAEFLKEQDRSAITERLKQRITRGIQRKWIPDCTARN